MRHGFTVDFREKNSVIFTGVGYTWYFNVPHKNNSQMLRSGDQGGHFTSPSAPLPILLLRNYMYMVDCTWLNLKLEGHVKISEKSSNKPGNVSWS